jgi:hypothetical protein
MSRKFQREAYKGQLVLLKFTILLMLVFGAVSPIFRHDSVANYVCLGSVFILAVLAGVSLLKNTQSCADRDC